MNEGGSRSTKTYSICQLIISLMLKESALFTIVRKTLPALKGSAYRDFLEIIKNNELYNPNNHNKSELIYRIKNSECEFISIDQWEKVRGRKRKYLFINEANETTYNDFIQLSLRTTGKIFLDLNPSHDSQHWIETKIKIRNDTEVIHSTYKDNPFIGKETTQEIERLKEADPNLWRIYGLGQMGIIENLVFTHWQLCEELPNGEMIYGLDFGYNNPTALVKIIVYDDEIYAQEIIHENRLTNQDLIKRMEELNISKGVEIYADSEDPNRIKELQEAGFNVIGTDKGKDSVAKGIDTLKSKGLYITKDSINGQKELRTYKWIEKDGIPTDVPVKFNDHFLDALRGAIFTHNKKVGLTLTWI